MAKRNLTIGDLFESSQDGEYSVRDILGRMKDIMALTETNGMSEKSLHDTNQFIAEIRLNKWKLSAKHVARFLVNLQESDPIAYAVGSTPRGEYTLLEGYIQQILEIHDITLTVPLKKRIAELEEENQQLRAKGKPKRYTAPFLGALAYFRGDETVTTEFIRSYLPEILDEDIKKFRDDVSAEFNQFKGKKFEKNLLTNGYQLPKDVIIDTKSSLTSFYKILEKVTNEIVLPNANSNTTRQKELEEMMGAVMNEINLKDGVPLEGQSSRPARRTKKK